ncbi:hypothetical protein D9M68_861720 [compost metagenome]
MQQTGAQMGFEGRYRAGDVGGGEVHALGSGGEAAGFRHADEGAHVEKDVHVGSWPRIGVRILSRSMSVDYG